MLANFREEDCIDLLPVRGERFGPAYCEGLARVERALVCWQMDLRDRLLIESLTRRRRVACEESGVTGVERRHLEPGEFLDA